MALPQPQPHPISERPHLVVVGNGMAAIRTVEELQLLKPDHYRITVFGAEPHGNYNRIMLSSVLAGDKTMDEIVTHPLDWYARHGITLHVGDPVESIDPELRLVTSAKGVVLAWDRLILATGSQALLPSIPGIALPGVCTFRDMKDVAAMVRASAQHRRAVVIGGGVLGLEAAWGLKQRGMEVAVIHMMPSLMERQLDDMAGQLLLQDLDRRGITCITGAQAEEILGDQAVSGVRLSDGRVMESDLVVIAVGIRPEVELARQAGLAVGRGVVVGDDMRSSDANIFAVGECVEHDGQCFGLVMPLWDMARVCAHHLAEGEEERRFTPPAVSTNLKIPGINIFSAGSISAANDHEQEIVHHDPDQRIYKKLVLRQGRVVGAVLYGDIDDSARFWQWMREGTDVGHLCANGLCQRGCGALDVSAMADSDLVCHCNGVTKAAMLAAIQDNGLTSLDQVCRLTRAGTGCGQCRVLTARVLAHALGDELDLEAVARQSRRMTFSFRLWHRANAVLMSVLILTGLGLHFPRSALAVLGFEWAHILHKYSGLALCAAFAGFLILCVVFGRRWRMDADSLTLFGVMPLVLASGLAFLWPNILPAQLGGISALVPVALGHGALAVLVLMFLIHHLSHAPKAWWQKRKLRSAEG